MADRAHDNDYSRPGLHFAMGCNPLGYNPTLSSITSVICYDERMRSGCQTHDLHPPLPLSHAEMAARGWDACDAILVTGDAYIDHPAFGAGLIGRFLEALGLRVGVIAAPDLKDPDAFRALGAPRLFWGVTAGNLDSQLARLTVMRKRRRDDPYLPPRRSPNAVRRTPRSHTPPAPAKSPTAFL